MQFHVGKIQFYKMDFLRKFRIVDAHLWCCVKLEGWEVFTSSFLRFWHKPSKENAISCRKNSTLRSPQRYDQFDSEP